VRALVRKSVPKSREATSLGPSDVRMELNALLYHGPKNHVTFGFSPWQILQDSSKLLDGTDPGKNLRHVKLREISNVHDANLKQLILEARPSTAATLGSGDAPEKVPRQR